MVRADKEGYVLTPCASTSPQPVAFAASARTFLDPFLHNGATEFFVDGWTDAANGDTATFVAIERADVVSGCDLPELATLVFRARGKEPPWTVDIEAHKAVLEFPGHAPVEASTWRFEDLPDGRRRFDGGAAFTLLLTPGLCHGNMAEAAFGWSAQLDAGEYAYEGCGFAGLASP
jgi:uncharacterized membrane protein